MQQHNNIIVTKELYKSNSKLRNKIKEIGVERKAWGLLNNKQSALLSKDFWREVDDATVAEARDLFDETPLASRLLGISDVIDIGKTASQYRVSSGAGRTTVSMSGKAATINDNVIYNYEGDPVPVFSAGYSRPWREWHGMQSVGFDAIADDHREVMVTIKDDISNYLLNGGDFSFEFAPEGITNHRNTNQIAIDKDLTTAKPDDIIEIFSEVLPSSFIDNRINVGSVEVWTSLEVWKNLEKLFSGADYFKEGTTLQRVKELSWYSSIRATREISGNHMVAFVPNRRHIMTNIAEPLATLPIERLRERDDYQFQISAILGLRIVKTFDGKSGVFNIKGA